MLEPAKRLILHLLKHLRHAGKPKLAGIVLLQRMDLARVTDSASASAVPNASFRVHTIAGSPPDSSGLLESGRAIDPCADRRGLGPRPSQSFDDVC
jgi:hypothetical protein